MKNTGALLKSKRESSSLSLSEVALATKINPKILAAIENGDEKNLPAKTFLKGFVRSYALFLKMDVDEVMRSFLEDTGGPPPERVNEIDLKKNEAPTPASRRRVGDESSSGMRTIAVVVIVVLIGLIIGVRELIEKYQREKVVESTADLKVTPVVPVAGAPTVDSATLAAAPGTLSGSQPAEVKADAKPQTKLAEVAKPSDTVAPSGDTVKPTDTASKTPEVVKVDPPKPAAPEVTVAVVKPPDTRTPEQKAAAESARPIAAPRPIDLIRGPINNLVELRPFELSPPKPIEETSTKMSATQAAAVPEKTDVKPEVKQEAPAEAPKPASIEAAKPAEVPKPVALAKAPEPAKPVEVTKPVAAINPPEPVKPPEPAKATEAPKPAEPAPAATDAASAATATLKAAKNEIILEALDNVEVKFQVKGETKRVSLNANQVHTLHVDLPVTLDLSDGGAVNIILNGRERGVPGDLGKPKTIKIP